MIKIFVDANIYLDFYKRKSVKALLKPLLDLAPHIFITQQVVNEVLRNRVEITRELLEKDIGFLKYKKPSLPDFLIEEAVNEVFPEIRKEFEKFEKDHKKLEDAAREIYRKTIQHVSCGDDEISRTLQEFFKNKLIASDDEIAKARLRKDFGNPPGKFKDPIGDEISWEQILQYRRTNGCDIWIISNDGDYCSTGFNNEVIPNAFLYSEITDGGPSVVFFKDLATAMIQFKAEVKNTLALPSPEEMQQIVAEDNIPNEVYCTHQPMMIQNGRFDVVICNKCKKQLGAYLSDFD